MFISALPRVAQENINVPTHNRMKWTTILLALAMLVLPVGCRRDPNLRKQKYLESGNRYLTAKKYREAAIQYQNAIQIDARFADAHYKLAQAQMGLGNWNAAFIELRKTVELAPQNMEAEADLGSLYAAGRAWSDAEKIAQVILAAQPNSPDGHAILTTAYMGREDLPRALEEAKLALQAAPDRVDLLIAMGRIQTRLKNTNEAERFLRKAIQLNPLSVSARLALSELYAETGRLDLSERNLQDAIALAPNTTIYQSYSRFLFAQGRLADAERLLIDAKIKLKDDPAAYRLLADFYVATGANDKAIAEYAQLTRDHPGDNAVWVSYVGLLLNTSRLDEAKNLVDEALRKNKKNLDALILKGQYLNISGRSREALEVLEPAVRSDPENALAQLQLGDALAATGQTDRAERAWRDSANLNSSFAAAQERLANVAIAKHDFAQLKSAGESLVRLHPTSPEGYLAQALAAASQNDPRGAETFLNQAITAAPGRPEGYAKMGEFLASQKKFDAATRMYEQALEKNPGFAEALAGEVKILLTQKQPFPRVIARINAQIGKSPNTDAYWVLLAEAQNSAGDSASAASSLQKALGMNPKNARAMMLFAQLETARGNIDSAIATYERLAHLNSSDPTAEIVIGALEQARGNFGQAQKRFEKALAIRPDDPVASNNLAYLLLESGGNKDLALSLAQTARRGMPDNPSIADTLGWALYQKEVYGAAREMLEEAAKKAPANAAVQYHLGMTYAKTMDKARAQQHMKKALELAPNGPNASAIKQYLSANKG